MKIKYRKSDGEILAWGPMPDLQAGEGEVIEDVSSEENLTGKIRVSKETYREKTEEEVDDTTPEDEKRLAELSEKKEDLTLEEINEVLRLKGII